MHSFPGKFQGITTCDFDNVNELLGRSSSLPLVPNFCPETKLEDEHYKHGFSSAIPFFGKIN